MYIKTVKIDNLEYGVESISTGEVSVTCQGYTTWYKSLQAAEKSLSVLRKVYAKKRA